MDEDKVLELIRRGEVVAAIKYVRECTGKDIQESKQYVDALRQDSQFVAPNSFSSEYDKALKVVSRIISSVAACQSLFDVSALLKLAEAEGRKIQYLEFLKWDRNSEFNAYEDDELLEEILGKDISGNLLIICDDLDKPYNVDLENLCSELDKLPRCLANNDFVLVETDRSIVTLVGHWGLCARISL